MTDFVFDLAPPAPISFALTGESASLTIAETIQPDVLLVLGAFMRGGAGPEGPAGPGAGPIQSLTAVASAALGGHRVVGITHDGSYGYVSNTTSQDALRAAGLTTGAAASDAAVTVQTKGPISEPSWAWTPDLPVYLGANGVPTQVVPTLAGGAAFVMVLGVALTPTSMFVQLGNPISF